MTGPLFGTGFMNVIGDINGFFIFIIASSIFLGVFTLAQMRRKDPVDESDKVGFTITPSRVAIGVSDVIEEKLKETSEDNKVQNVEDIQ